MCTSQTGRRTCDRPWRPLRIDQLDGEHRLQGIHPLRLLCGRLYHPVKTHAHPLARNPTGSINDALATEMEAAMGRLRAAAPAFATGGSATAGADDASRACPARVQMTSCGAWISRSRPRSTMGPARSARTSTAPTPPTQLRATVYAAFDACRARWGKRACLSKELPICTCRCGRTRPRGEARGRGGVDEGVLLGAYCGNVADTPEHETAAALDALFSYAIKHILG